MGGLLWHPGVPHDLRRAGWLHPQSASFHATEEMEEAEEIPADDDSGWISGGGSEANLGQDGPMAIGGTTTGALCPQPEVVSPSGSALSRRLYATESQTDVCSLIEERLTWPVRAVLSGGGGASPHFLPGYIPWHLPDPKKRIQPTIGLNAR